MSLDNQELLTLYHMVFVFIFVATAIVALGGIMKVGPFQKIPPQYVKLLVSALIIELIASVLIVFKNLPEIKTINVERYSYYIKYEPYINEWLDSNDIALRTMCFGLNGNRPVDDPPSDCKEIIQEFNLHDRLNGKQGEGQFFLTINGNALSGIVSAKIGQESSYTVLHVEGVIKNDTERELTFIREETCETPRSQNKVTFTRNPENALLGKFTSTSNPSYDIAEIVLREFDN